MYHIVKASDEEKQILFQNTAEKMAAKGYRKASEVARKVIDEAITLIEDNWEVIQHGDYWLINGRCRPLRELLKTIEKKYTEGDSK